MALIARKGLGAVLSYVLVPVLLDYLDPLRYGVWITMVSVVNWLYIFDVGLGNGMQNALASALARKNREQGQIIVSTTYSLMIFIAMVLLLVIAAAGPLLDWGVVFNVDGDIAADVALGVGITVVFYVMQLVVRLIGVVLTADERPALAGYFNTIGSIVTLVVVLLVKPHVPGSIALLSCIMGVANLLPPVVASFVLYRSQYRDIRPSWNRRDMSLAPELFMLGGKFLVMQLSAVVIYTTDNMIITQMFSPAEVTPYALAAKYVGFVTIGYGIILKPFWASFTHAHELGEVVWIRRMVKKLHFMWGGVVFATFTLVAVSPYIYDMWLGGKVDIPMSLTILMGIHVVMFNYGQIYSKYLNGVGKLEVQFRLSIITAIINIPISMFFAGPLGMGVNGVILGTICTNIPVVLAAPYQYYQLSTGRAQGIWSK